MELLNRKLEIENEVIENKIKIEIKVKTNIGMSVDIVVVDTVQK